MEQQVKIYQQFLMKYIINFVNIKFLNKNKNNNIIFEYKVYYDC